MVNLGSIIIPFIFSFHPKLNFNKKWRSTFLSIFIVTVFFIAWDICFSAMGVWGFNPNYLVGFNIFNLPIEEVLFFVCIPYACLYTYHCLKILIPPFTFPYFKTLLILIASIILALGLIHIDKWYTSVTFISLSIALIYFEFVNVAQWLKRACFVSLILIIPFFIVNGILTGTGIESEVVWYNNSENMNFRIVTIPVEDFGYGFLLILFNTYFFEKFEYLNDKGVERKARKI
jgi:lycopene cyclase domain-containing protein